jgi:hypothetical protein
MKSMVGIGYFRSLAVKKKIITPKPKPAQVVNGE